MAHSLYTGRFATSLGPLLGVAVTILAGLAPRNLTAQTPYTVGGVAGWVSSRQIWSGPAETDYLEGFLVGAFAEVKTPIALLSVRAEGHYVQRGTVVLREGSELDYDGVVRGHYLSAPIHLKVGRSLGPLSLSLLAGPTFEVLLHSRLSSGLESVILEEQGMVISATVGAGVGLQLTDERRVELKIRLTEGIGDAYQGHFVTMRNRSIEALLRVGVSRLAGGNR